MSEMFQGFFACIGAALFFGTVVTALKAVVWRSPWPSHEDDDSGAPEGDQLHFRIVDDPRSSRETPARPRIPRRL
ncbi:hypothetical protein BJ928_106263 [Rhizobium sp. WW_1]|jgi:hypothetical protein|nr:hypothetical protein BJ928_106263 [Rhizobium sp. WW_1]